MASLRFIGQIEFRENPTTLWLQCGYNVRLGHYEYRYPTGREAVSLGTA